MELAERDRDHREQDGRERERKREREGRKRLLGLSLCSPLFSRSPLLSSPLLSSLPLPLSSPLLSLSLPPLPPFPPLSSPLLSSPLFPPSSSSSPLLSFLSSPLLSSPQHQVSEPRGGPAGCPHSSHSASHCLHVPVVTLYYQIVAIGEEDCAAPGWRVVGLRVTAGSARESQDKGTEEREREQ